MSALVLLIPIALMLGLIGLAAFLWALQNGQFDDPEGSAARILDDDVSPLPSPPTSQKRKA